MLVGRICICSRFQQRFTELRQALEGRRVQDADALQVLPQAARTTVHRPMSYSVYRVLCRILKKNIFILIYMYSYSIS